MTSVLRRFAQINPRSQFMVVIEEAGAPYVIYNPVSNITSEPVMAKEDFIQAYPLADLFFPAGSMIKDLGRFIHVYDPANSNNLWQVYRQMMLVSGTAQEGISSKIGYVCTWSADGTSQALLARVG